MFENTQTANRPTSQFYVILSVSILLHIFFVTQFQWNKTADTPKEELIEVEFLKIPEPAPPKKTTTHNYKSPVNRKTVQRASTGTSKVEKSSKTIAPVTKPKPEKPVPPPPPKIEKPVLNVKSKVLHFKSDGGVEQAVPLSQRQLEIPQVKPELEQTEPDSTPVPKAKNPLKTVPLSKAQKQQTADVKNIEVERLVGKNVVNEAKTPVFSESVKSVPTQKSGSQNLGSGDEKKESGYQEGVTIEGEISKRKVIYKPSPPELDIDRDVTVVLKFTVLPNGEVDQVFPYKKADPELERVAINMLHQYRFEPLFGSNLVQEGIIRFIIYRKSP